MESSNNRGHKTSTRQLLLPSETFRVRHRQPNQVVGQRSLVETQTIHAIAETINSPPQNHGKVLLPKITAA